MRAVIAAFLVSLSIPFAQAQEESGDEVIDEIRNHLRGAQIANELLLEQTKLSERRIELLKKGLQVRGEQQELEKKIEQAEKNGDDDQIESLEQQIDLKNVWLEMGREELELLRQSAEFFHIARDMILSEDFPEKDTDPFQRIWKLQRKRLDLHRKLYKAIESDNEEAVDEIEEQLDELGGEVEGRFELLELQRELMYAEEEGEEEAIRELQEHIDEIREELGEPHEDETTAPEPEPDLKDRDAQSLPIKLHEAEIVDAGSQRFEHRMANLLTNTCGECHDSASAMGDLNLERLATEKPLVVNRKHWINVIEQLKNRSMPPAEAESPSESDRRYMVAWLTNEIQNFDYATVHQVGYEPAKRLTHDEYNHTIRDLFGVDLRPADKFPDDMVASSGFDNSANSLFIQAITMERYVGAADEVAQRVFSQEASRKRFYSVAKDPANAQQVLTKFAGRAFRRKPQPQEISPLLTHFHKLRSEGQSYDVAMQNIVQAILVSPSFLIRSERQQHKHDSYRIDDWELASRLSYFLWASMPDDELFALAEKQQLHKPDVLLKQVNRMIADPKSSTLGSLFAAQWLGYTNLNRVRPGPIDNPWCTDSLCDAILQESGMFFHSLVTTNAPIDRLIDSDYTFLNEELAKHYRMPGIKGDHMRRVDLKETPRGGILGHASVLAITSFPGRTSPVLRGNWILTELLGTPPPPPPPNASEFDERIAENRRLTQRQKLQRHRDNANCYACHSQIDPLGFSLERFDWFGRYKPSRKLSARGEFPDGTQFVGLSGLRSVIIDQRMDDLVAQLTRKMLSYALGRQLEYYDESTVRQIISKTNNDDRRIQTLIRAIVLSDTFQMQQPRKQNSQPVTEKASVR